MTPADFASRYRATAEQVSLGTGIDPIALLTQWAAETAWGTVVIGNNLGNIRCSPTTFCQYATLSDFAVSCIATFHNGFYQPVLAANNAVDQIAAIVASPWSAGHYGGSLAAFYTQLEGLEMTPDEHNTLYAIQAIVNRIEIDVTGQAGTILAESLSAKLDALKAQIAAIPPGAGLTPAQAQQLSTTLSDVQAILAKLSPLTLHSS